MRPLFFSLLCACGTTIHASDYAHDCDADNQCARILVGDICSCSCQFAAINVRDMDKYFSDLQRIGACRNTCTDDAGDDASFTCGQGIGAQCTAGSCAIYALPADAATE